MQGNVHKKKTDVDLWEIVTPEKKRMPKSGTSTKNGTRQQEGAKRASSRPAKSLQIIGQDEEIRPIRQSRPVHSDKQSRSVQPIGQNMTSRSVRQSRSVQPIGQSMTSRSVRQSRSVQSIGQSRASQPVRQSRPMQPARQRRVAQPVRQRTTQAYRQERSPQALKRRKARKRRAYLYRAMAFFMVTFCVVSVFMLVGLAYQSVQEWKRKDDVPVTKIPVVEEPETVGITAPNIMTSYLEINDYSRPGTKLDEINSIFVHYTANPGTSAAQNRSYFSNLPETKERSASAHFIIGYEGEIIQCIPVDEQAYAVISRNDDSISIECCYLEKDGEFTQATYDSLVHLLAWLLQEYGLETSDILRHYDCGGKLCPLYYVENEDAWDKLLEDVGAYQGEQEEK